MHTFRQTTLLIYHLHLVLVGYILLVKGQNNYNLLNHNRRRYNSLGNILLLLVLHKMVVQHHGFMSSRPHGYDLDGGMGQFFDPLQIIPGVLGQIVKITHA